MVILFYFTKAVMYIHLMSYKGLLQLLLLFNCKI